MAQKVNPSELHRVVVACIIHNRTHAADEPRFLLLKRHPEHKVYPGLWGVPSGGIELSDFADPHADPLETAARRETREESGLEVGILSYLSAFRFVRPDGIPVIGMRFYAPYLGGSVVLDTKQDATEFVWSTAAEAKRRPLLPDLADELAEVRARLVGR